jgi:aspartokinase
MTPRKTKANRLKVSDAMIGISIRQDILDSNFPDALFHVFAKHRINLTFISARQTNQKSDFFCCVIAEKLNSAKQLLDKTMTHTDRRYRIIPSVTLLSVFPHYSDIRLVCQLLLTLWNAQIPVHAVASSIAALTLVVETDRIESTVEILENFLGIHSDGQINQR